MNVVEAAISAAALTLLLAMGCARTDPGTHFGCDSIEPHQWFASEDLDNEVVSPRFMEVRLGLNVDDAGRVRYVAFLEDCSTDGPGNDAKEAFRVLRANVFTDIETQLHERRSATGD